MDKQFNNVIITLTKTARFVLWGTVFASLAVQSASAGQVELEELARMGINRVSNNSALTKQITENSTIEKLQRVKKRPDGVANSNTYQQAGLDLIEVDKIVDSNKLSKQKTKRYKPLAKRNNNLTASLNANDFSIYS
ncbi:MAG: hypothetical protein V2I33_11630, partial [Kangiellaceae bacterium]|nr:hypothetical protein [Kangiellaceae bacterium]